jgi:hypothetical protein
MARSCRLEWCSKVGSYLGYTGRAAKRPRMAPHDPNATWSFRHEEAAHRRSMSPKMHADPTIRLFDSHKTGQRMGSPIASRCAAALTNAAHQTCQLLTSRTMSETSLCRLVFGHLVFANAAQQNPLCVRTAMVAVPGRLPLCHQSLALLTIHPFA